MKIFAALLIFVVLVCPWMIGEAEGYAEGYVEFSFPEKETSYAALSAIQVMPKGFQTEDVMNAFSLPSEDTQNLSVYNNGFVYENTLGLALSDALYMVDHENLDQLSSFDLSFMSIEEACAYAVSCFDTLGIPVDIEAAYAIDSPEYDRLYEAHKEWITDMGRGKWDWTDDDNSYVIYLNQEYEGIPVYPGIFWYENVYGNYPGTEIVVFLSKDGFEYVSCTWPTAMTDCSKLEDVMDFETAKTVFAKAHNDLLMLTPKRITVCDADLMYITFENEDGYLLKPFWVFRAKNEDGEQQDYILDAVSGEVFGL